MTADLCSNSAPQETPTAHARQCAVQLRRNWPLSNLNDGCDAIEAITLSRYR